MRKLFSSKRPKEKKDKYLVVDNDSTQSLRSSSRSKSPSGGSLPVIDAAKEILGGVKYTLKLAQGPLQLLPIPLLSEAIGAILAIIAAFEASSQNKRQVEALRDHIQSLLANVLNPIMEVTNSALDPGTIPVPYDLVRRVEALSRQLILASRLIQKLDGLSNTSSILRGEEVAQTLIGINTSINLALKEFQLGGQITTELLVRQIHSHMLDQTQRDLLDKLPFAPAEFSNSKTKASECLENTREELLQEIRTWIETESRKAKPVVFMSWLCGIPGAGKSTVAMTIAKYLDDTGRLGASFFFSRDDNECNNSSYVMPTIARQLAFFNPTIAGHATEFLKTHPDFGNAVMSLQLEKLIIEPIRRAHENNRLAPFVIVLDALDECANSAQAQKLLDILASEFRKLPFPILLFITSRPEFHLASKFTSSLINPISSHIMLHDIDNVTVTLDITRYLEKHLGTVASEHPRAPRDKTWPDPEDIRLLAQRASGLFIYAVTTVAFVSNPRSLPENQLRLVLTLQPQTTSTKHKPYVLIDTLYLRVLADASTDEEVEYDLSSIILTALGTVVTLVTPLPYDGLRQLLNIEDEILYDVLTRLTSVIHYDPRVDNDNIRVMHQSFPDFLARCDDLRFRVDARAHNVRLASLCLRVLLSDSLKRGMCPELGLSTMNSDIPNIHKSIPSHLAYACVWFTTHLESANAEDALELLIGFLKTKLLYWLEALSLIGELDTAISSLKKIDKWYSERCSKDDNIAKLMQDSQRFVHQFFDPILRCAAHVYHSALSFMPTCALLEVYRSELVLSNVNLSKGRDHHWGSCLRTIEGHTNIVTAVAFSSDNLRIVSASFDETVRIWDAISGAPQATLEGHSAPVRSVTFTSDDSQIVSGSEDNTIRFWDATSGALRLVIKSDSGSIFATALSSDDTRVVSGGSDNMVKIWNARSGELQATLESHQEAVLSVAMSPDNARIASASNDGTVKLWDIATATLIATLKGHIDWVKAVAFSPDGSRVASAACDNTIILWNTTTYEQEATLEGHSNWVRSVSFSSNGRRIVSGSSDKTVRIWDADSGEIQSVYEGHGSDVGSVFFSSDDSQIVSGSSDNMIRVWDGTATARPTNAKSRLDAVAAVAFSSNNDIMVAGLRTSVAQVWDACTGTLKCTLSGHSDSVWAVAISADDSKIATGSKDNTAAVWDMKTCDRRATLKGHTAWVWSVALTSDGARVATSSGDRSVRLWDSSTGAVLATFDAESTVVTVAFSGDETRLVAGYSDGTIRTWNVASGAQLAKCEGHGGFVVSAIVSSDMKMVISHSLDKSVRVWDSSTGAQLAKWEDAEVLVNESFYLDRSGWMVRISTITLTIERICWIPVPLRKFCQHFMKKGEIEYFRTTHENNVGGQVNTSVLFSVKG